MLLIDKPYGWTSFAVVAQLKRWTKAKIGHAGTLDPLASGLMICCTGKKTKLLGNLLGLPKEYTGIIRLGATTPTYDLESEPVPSGVSTLPNEAAIRAQAVAMTGELTQFPPIHSALKQDGKPLYELARKGVDITVKLRTVQISAFDITAIQGPEVHFRITCSSGTYIRSMANDFGAALGCGGFLQALCRTAIGEYRLEEAYTIDEMAAHYGSKFNAKIIVPKVF
ncbi:MAG: tRNA pseudouridine(55) synthase TruB [Chitinophagaceae bacterium]|nr:tRNA pseudouridine(55) synthase TruB [Chitinophagaceae bacterium]